MQEVATIKETNRIKRKEKPKSKAMDCKKYDLVNEGSITAFAVMRLT